MFVEASKKSKSSAGGERRFVLRESGLGRAGHGVSAQTRKVPFQERNLAGFGRL
jgi:hypothetical protein